MKKITLQEVDEALFLALENTKPIQEKEIVSIFNALNRVLAQDIVCKKALPAFDNSAMDGYVVKLSDAGKEVDIKGAIFAGDFPQDVEIKEGMVYKIMTGAYVPKGSEAVVPFEDVEIIDEERIKLPNKIKQNAHIRFRGEEINEDEIILKEGDLLRPAHIAVLASQGITNIKVFRKLKAAIISTGSEIKEPWQQAKTFQIYNSNSSAIYASALEMNIDISYIGAVEDSKEKILQLVDSFRNYDVVFTSGGVSVGEADFTDEVLKSAGLKTIVHGVAIKPGKHALFGLLENTAIIGLPGNPLSSLATFMLFATPIIAKMQGRKKFYPTISIAKNSKTFSFKGRRANLILGTVLDGVFYATQDYKYSSGMLTPVTKSNCFIVAKKGVEVINKDDEVRIVLPFAFSEDTPSNIFTS